MLDDLRQQAGDSFLDEPEDPIDGFERPLPPRRFLGMSPVQTFVISLLLFLITCLLSASCLLVTGRMVPPFL
ncbi:MAG: hypothetical protein ACKOC5_15375 [Chloroflexota bacterium]